MNDSRSQENLSKGDDIDSQTQTTGQSGGGSNPELGVTEKPNDQSPAGGSPLAGS